MQVKLGKTVRVGDSYNVVDNSNRSAFVLIGASVVENGLAKPIYTRAHEATKHLVTTKQRRLPLQPDTSLTAYLLLRHTVAYHTL